MLDHYNAAALERYLDAVGDKLLGAVPEHGIRSIFCDSLEVYGANSNSDSHNFLRSSRCAPARPSICQALFDEEASSSKHLARWRRSGARWRPS